MLPIDTITSKNWSHESATAKIKEIRGAINDDLRRRDAGHGIGPNGQVYTDPLAGTADSEGKSSIMQVDPVKARARSTGGDHVTMLKARWSTFCSEPRSEAEFIEASVGKDRQEAHKAAVKAAAAVEASIPSDDAPKRRGRPPGVKNKTTDTPAVTASVGAAVTETAVAEG